MKSVVPAEDVVLFVDFGNGESGTLDMKPVLDFGLFRRLKDPDAFAWIMDPDGNKVELWEPMLWEPMFWEPMLWDDKNKNA